MSTEELRELLALAEAATPGPWESEVDRFDAEVYTGRGFVVAKTTGEDLGFDQSPRNAAFIAAANPETVKALVQEVLRLRAERDGAYSQARECNRITMQAEEKLKQLRGCRYLARGNHKECPHD